MLLSILREIVFKIKNKDYIDRNLIQIQSVTLSTYGHPSEESQCLCMWICHLFSLYILSDIYQELLLCSENVQFHITLHTSHK